MKVVQTIKTPDIEFHVVRGDEEKEWLIWATLQDGSLPADGFIVGDGDSPKAALRNAVKALCTSITKLTTALAAK